MSNLVPPIADVISATRTHHGDTVRDDYRWLTDRENPATIAYITAENAYTQARTADQAPLREAIFTEIRTRTKETDLSVPIRMGAYWYYTRTVEGQQYLIHCRRAVIVGESDPPSTSDGSPLTGEQILLDGNGEAGDSEFFAIGTFDVSPDGNLLAYSVDLTGDERFTMRFKDLRSGEQLGDTVDDVFYGSAWSRDASVVFYLTVDEAWRPHRLWRHTLGDSGPDTLVLEEPDERFWVGVDLSRSREFILIDVHSKLTSEVLVIPADHPLLPPRVIAPRRQGVEYGVEHDATNGRFLILHNDGAMDFELAWAPVDDPGTWHTLIGHMAGVRLLEVDAFAAHTVVSLRRDGLTAVRVLPYEGEPYDVDFPETIYTVGLSANPEFWTSTVRLAYTSLVTPSSVYDIDLDTRAMVLRKQQPVLGGYDPQAYEQRRDWATAPDGTRIPLSIVVRRDTPRDGAVPTVLYGYGSYEASMDPYFSIARLSLLDRGVAFAIAHVRGGGELGRQWYEQGRMLTKTNTFLDFIACATHLVATGWTVAERIVARGGSAGGLLMGAVANLAPGAFAGIVAEVPFVDALNTILDPTLPLTITEWEEWGNPLESPEVYAYLKAYSPYENIVSGATYPAILAVGSLHDTRVLYHEPTRWIARLRALAPGDYLLKIEMEAGHGGRSGRYDGWREEAFVLAWILTLLGRGTPSARG